MTESLRIEWECEPLKHEWSRADKFRFCTICDREEFDTGEVREGWQNFRPAPETYKRGDQVLVTDPETGRVQRGRVETVHTDGALYIEGPPLPQDSRVTAWQVSAGRVAELVRPAK